MNTKIAIAIAIVVLIGLVWFAFPVARSGGVGGNGETMLGSQDSILEAR